MTQKASLLLPGEDRPFQEKTWLVQHILKALLLLVIIASAFDVFGTAIVVLKSSAVYLLVFVLLRTLGRHAIGEMNPFDLVLLLLISEACQNAMVGDDSSLLAMATACGTFGSWEIVLALVREKWKTADRVLDGVPTVLIREGVIDTRALKKSGMDRFDLFREARRQCYVTEMDQIRYAVLEADGKVSIIPRA